MRRSDGALPDRALLSPLAAGLLLAGLLSTASGIVGHGIYFLTHEVWRFEDGDNLLLAAAMFVPYVPAALLSGRVAGRFGARRAVVGITLGMVACAAGLAAEPAAGWVWVLAPLYNAGAGMLWPMVEASVVSGQRGGGLYRSVGWFNLCWAGALAPSLWLVHEAGSRVDVVFGVLIGLQLLALLGVPFLRTGGDHGAAGAEVPGEWRALLRAARVLLPLSYLLLDCVVPMLPGIWGRLGVEAGALLSPVWMVARFLTFGVLIFSRSWQGSAAVLFAGALLLAGGVAGVLLAPWAGGAAGSAAGLAAAVAGLAAVGVGQGIVYHGALFYGMAVAAGARQSGAEVEAGGWHEAVIGLGYVAGPLLSWAGLWAGTGPVPPVAAAVAAGLMLARWRMRLEARPLLG